MTNQSLVPVILAGGKGERFWPLSRRKRPKQFLSLDGSGRSLLQGHGRPLAGDRGWLAVGLGGDGGSSSRWSARATARTARRQSFD
jgi:hypothetical protein